MFSHTKGVIGFRHFDLIPLFVKQTAQVHILNSASMLENNNYIWREAVNRLF